MCTPCIPGDKFNISCEALIRFAPMIAPVMHRIDVYMHYFFVPNRLLWNHWEDYITNGGAYEDGTQTLPAFPYFTVLADGSNYSPLMDHLGIPDPAQNTSTVNQNVSALPFKAYFKIFEEYYRDQNLDQFATPDLIDGNNNANLADMNYLQVRAFEHDYFTACLPFAQKGNAVEIPISGEVALAPSWDTIGFPKFVDGTGNTIDGTVLSEDVGGAFPDKITLSTDTVNPRAYDPQGTLEVSNAETTINDLRRATALQRFLEKMARGGSRYIEQIKVMFGVSSSDKRLQRPEYITGTKSPVVISEVLNTTGTTDAPQGSMAGHGASVTSGQYGSYYCEEHGYIMGIMSILPKTAYQQGMPKHFLKINDPYEHFFPDFAYIGEQEVLRKEVYAYHASGDSVFGYVPRYAEYKFENNKVAGDFRDSLDFWHLGRIFGAAPSLNDSFIKADPSYFDRIFAVQDETDNMWCHVFNKVQAFRLMPKYGTPTF